jgi:phosphoribosylformylglycinamidine synthase
MITHRVYVEKRNGFDLEAQRLKTDIAYFFGNQYSCLAKIKKLRILHRYDVEGLSKEQFEKAVQLVFSEPCCDSVFFFFFVPSENTDLCFGIEYLPG